MCPAPSTFHLTNPALFPLLETDSTVHHVNTSICQTKQRLCTKCVRHWLGTAFLSHVFFFFSEYGAARINIFPLATAWRLDQEHGHRWASCKTMGSGHSHLVNYQIFGLFPPEDQRKEGRGHGWNTGTMESQLNIFSYTSLIVLSRYNSSTVFPI